MSQNRKQTKRSRICVTRVYFPAKDKHNLLDTGKNKWSRKNKHNNSFKSVKVANKINLFNCHSSKDMKTIEQYLYG